MGPEMMNRTKVVHIFLRIPTSSENSTLVVDPLQNVMKLHTESKMLAVLSRRVYTGTREQPVGTYLY